MAQTAHLSFSTLITPLMELVKAEVYRETLNLPQTPPAFLRLAERNGLLMLVLMRTSSNERIAPLTDRLDHLRQLQADAAARAGSLCSYFAEKGLPVIPIKSFMKYPYVDHDLDIVAVEKDKIQAYKQELLRLGYHYKPSKSRIREPDKWFFCPSVDDAVPVARLHLHEALSWNGVLYLDSADVWGRHTLAVVNGHEFPVPSPEDEFLIAAAHAIFENAEIRLGEVLEMIVLIRDEQINWDYIITKANDKNWASGLALFLETSFAMIDAMRVQIDIPLNVREWAQNTLQSVNAFPLKWNVVVTYPLRIPYPTCMRVYLNKLRLDFQGGRMRELHRACASYFIFIWISRLRTSRTGHL